MINYRAEVLILFRLAAGTMTEGKPTVVVITDMGGISIANSGTSITHDKYRLNAMLSGGERCLILLIAGFLKIY